MDGRTLAQRSESQARAEPAPSHLQAWARDAADVITALNVDPEVGLGVDEVRHRRLQFGSNQLSAVPRRGVFGILLAQFQSVVVWLLITASVVSLGFGDVLESLAIAVVIVINSGLGFLIELRAVRSIEALRRLGNNETTVRRDGSALRVPAESLVPGDIVLVEGGDVITADMRLVAAAKLEVDESTLTGESVPVAKDIGTLPVATHLADRTNMLFKGTAVTQGKGTAVITAIGLQTELGEITELVLEADAGQTPLEQRLDQLARRLVWITLGIAAAVAIVGILGGRELSLAIEIAIALAVAAIPEGLPIVATIALARGMWRMANRRALVVRLSAVETLGATSIVLTDKTGTLTENRMTVSALVLPDGVLHLSGTGLDLTGRLSAAGAAASPAQQNAAHALLEAAVLCNTASLGVDRETGSPTFVGDPTEAALLVAAAKLGIGRDALARRWPQVAEEPFDPATRAMATFHRDGSVFFEAVKGAPEAIIDVCSRVRREGADEPLSASDRAAWLAHGRALGAQGLRTLAIAMRHVAATDVAPYEDLTLLGLVGVHDPARPGVREALAACRDSGIAVVMATGDHAATARAIAEDLGLVDADAPPSVVLDARELGTAAIGDSDRDRLLADARVIARASPQQKLELVELHQRQDRVVAMTGDGVNDAPALRKADIGIAMGQRGTQVAREAAAMILQDDRFETIVEAVAQGRAIYANIRKFVIYLLSCNFSEILIVGLATLGGAPLPLLPLQILFLNLVTDVFPALALGVGEGSTHLMRQRPRPAGEPLLARRHWSVVFAHGLVMSVAVLLALTAAMQIVGLDTQSAVTVSFLTLAFAQLWHVFNMRDEAESVIDNDVTRNLWVWAALVLCVALTFAAVYVPSLATVLSLSPPGTAGWIIVITMSVVPLVLGSVVRRVAYAMSSDGGPGARS